MNKIKEIFDNISDEELKLAISEIKESENTGVFENDDVVRKYSNMIKDITFGSYSDASFSVQISLLKEAAFRWSNAVKK